MTRADFRPGGEGIGVVFQYEGRAAGRIAVGHLPVSAGTMPGATFPLPGDPGALNWLFFRDGPTLLCFDAAGQLHRLRPGDKLASGPYEAHVEGPPPARTTTAPPHPVTAGEVTGTLADGGARALQTAEVEVISPAGKSVARAAVTAGGLRVGKGKDAQLRVPDPFVSQVHCLVAAGPRGFEIFDLQSKNGVILRGVRVQQALLPFDEPVQIGQSQLVLRAAEKLPLRGEPWQPPYLAGTSPAFRAALETAWRYAAADIPVLITGESGTGKELFARYIHEAGPRQNRPYVPVNAAALAPELVMSELFGHAAGAFTGARTQHEGWFAQARDGTLFLDEAGDLPLPVQAALLRVLETRTYRPVGGKAEHVTQARVIAATNRDLKALVATGTFRADLLYRLDVLRLELPPLRNRAADIRTLAGPLLAAAGLPRIAIAETAWRRLEEHAWPGNIRELRNCLIRAAYRAGAGPIQVAHIEFENAAGKPSRPTNPAEIIRDALAASGGNVAQAARQLGLSRAALRRAMERHGEAADSHRHPLRTRPTRPRGD